MPKQINRRRGRNLRKAFAHNSAPGSGRGTRTGGNRSYNPPGAPSALQDAGGHPKTYVELETFQTEKRNNPYYHYHFL